MAHKIWLGPAGSGKTHALIKRYLEQLKNSGQTRLVFLVVPTHEHANRVRNLLLRESGQAGLMAPHVLTFNELMEKLAGPVKRGDISNSLRVHLLREVLLETKNELSVFNQVADLPGFLKVLVNLISEFENLELIGPRAQTSLELLPAPGLLKAKLRDFVLVSKKYFLKLNAQKLFSQSELYRRWADRLSARPDVLKTLAAIYFDGFFDLNPVQQTWLRILSRPATEIVFTLTAESHSNRRELFEIPAKTLNFFKNLNFEIQNFSNTQRFLSADLKFLEKNIFSDAPDISTPVKNLAVLKPVSPRFEIKMLAQKIRHLLLEDPALNLSDICVVYHDLAFVRADIQTVFDGYELAVHVHERIWFKEIPLIGFLLGVLDLILNNWKAAQVMNYLKSDFLNLDQEFKANLELFGMLYPDWEGAEAWNSGWDFLGGKAEFQKTDIHLFRRSRQTALAPLLALNQALQAADQAGDAGNSLKKFLHQIVFGAKDIFECDRGDVFAYEELLRTLEELEAHFETGYEMQKYLEHLKTAIEIHLVSLPAPDADAVQVYTVSLARQKEYRVVFVAGLIEKQFPKQMFENPVFSDAERQLIHEGLSQTAEKRRNEKYLYYLALTRAREKLFLSYPQYNEEAQETLPSFFLQQTLELFGKDKIPEIHQDYLGQMHGLVPLLRGDYELMAVDRLKHQKPLPFKIKNLEQGLNEKFDLIGLDELQVNLNQVPAAFFKNEFSPTRLNDLSQCAYRYFAKHELHLKARPDWQARKSQARGNFYHDVLFGFYSQMIQQSNWQERSETELKALMEAEIENASRSEKHDWLQSSKLGIRLEKEKIKKKLFEFIENDHRRLISRGLKPVLLESDLEATLKTKHLNLKLRGRVDRVDQSAQGQYLLRDYKTSWKFKAEDVKVGLALQIPTYLYLMSRIYAAGDILGGEIYAIHSDKPNGIYQVSAREALKDLGSRKVLYLEPDAFQRLLLQYEKLVETLIHTRREQGVTIHPKSCDYCEFSGLCRYQTWMQKFISQEKLEEVMSLT